MKTLSIFQALTIVICICFIVLAICFFIEVGLSKQLKQERNYFANRLKTVEDSLAALPDSIISIFPTNQFGRPAHYKFYPHKRPGTLKAK